MKYLLIFVGLMLLAAIGNRINTKEVIAEQVILDDQKPLVNTRALPNMIGAYTPLDIIWVDTRTFAVTTENGNMKEWRAKTLAEALDYMEWITAQHTTIYDQLPRGCWITGNPFADSICMVYKAGKDDYLIHMGWLYPERKVEGEDYNMIYTYRAAKDTTLVHRLNAK